jgi:hypothetical protein
MRKATWAIVITAIAVNFGFAFFFWEIVDRFNVFLVPHLSLVPLALLGVALIVSILLPILRWNKYRTGSLLPLAFVIACAALLFFNVINFTDLWLRTNFILRRGKREEVVRRIAGGELKPNVDYNPALIALPHALACTSFGGGQVIVTGPPPNQKILFFTFRGVLRNFSGFVYSPDDSTPADADFAEHFFEVQKFDAHWYYVSSSGAHQDNSRDARD